MPLAPGDVVAGKYRIERPLGEGGMGRVYVATHQILRKQVALKVMAERFRVDADAVERFFREAVAATKIDHPAIVTIFDADVHDGAPFMAMELLEGEDLDQRLAREGRLPLEETLRIARPVLSALDAAHRAGVVHRDIKPPNIFLAKRANGVVTPKLLDFGIAKHLNDPAFDRLTQTGSILGTPLYLSPEQARADGTIDHRADIYAIGVTLYHCLTGDTPWAATSFGDLIAKMFSTPPRPLAELAPEVPPEICTWIERCLSLDPSERPESAGALLEGLDAALADSRKVRTPTAFAKTDVPQTNTADPAPRPPDPQPAAPPVATPPPAPSPVQAADTAAAPNAWTEAAASAKDPPERRGGVPVGLLAAAALLVVGGVSVVAWIAFDGGDADPAASLSVDTEARPTAPPDPVAATPVTTADASRHPDSAIASDSSAPSANTERETNERHVTMARRRPTMAGRATGTLRITSPEEATVSIVDGRVLGTTPSRTELPPGEYRIRVAWEDGRSRTRSVTIRPGHTISENVRPAPMPQVVAPAASPREIRRRLRAGFATCARRFPGLSGWLDVRIESDGRARVVGSEGDDHALQCYGHQVSRISFPTGWAGARHRIEFPPRRR